MSSPNPVKLGRRRTKRSRTQTGKNHSVGKSKEKNRRGPRLGKAAGNKRTTLITKSRLGTNLRQGEKEEPGPLNHLRQGKRDKPLTSRNYKQEAQKKKELKSELRIVACSESSRTVTKKGEKKQPPSKRTASR